MVEQPPSPGYQTRYKGCSGVSSPCDGKCTWNIFTFILDYSNMHSDNQLSAAIVHGRVNIMTFRHIFYQQPSLCNQCKWGVHLYLQKSLALALAKRENRLRGFRSTTDKFTSVNCTVGLCRLVQPCLFKMISKR